MLNQSLKKIILMILTIFFIGCSSFQSKLTPEETVSETKQVIEILKTNPDWLKESETCPTKLMPEFEKEVFYLDEGCENNPKKCLEKCKDKDANACYSLALLIQRKVDIREKESIPLYLRACKLGIVSGCTNYAAGHVDLNAEDMEMQKCAADTFEKTCERDDSWGCTMFGMILIEGKYRERDVDKALNILAKSCKSGIDDEACKQAKLLENEIYKLKKESAK